MPKPLRDQGKVARCLQTSRFPSTNNWSYEGTGLRFCDWRFIHQDFRLSDAVHHGSFVIDQVVPGEPGNNRPDLVITENKVSIIDVTCPFENDEDALRYAADELYMSKRYRTLFRKLCCAEAIKGSRNIHMEHLTGVPQL